MCLNHFPILRIHWLEPYMYLKLCGLLTQVGFNFKISWLFVKTRHGIEVQKNSNEKSIHLKFKQIWIFIDVFTQKNHHKGHVKSKISYLFKHKNKIESRLKKFKQTINTFKDQTANWIAWLIFSISHHLVRHIND